MPKKGSYFRNFWLALEYREEPLCLFWRENYRELCLREPARPEEKKHVGQSWVRLQSSEPDFDSSGRGARQFKPKTRGWSVGFKTWVQSSRSRVWSQERTYRAMKTMTRDVWDFRFVLTLAITNTQKILKSAWLHLPSFCSSESVFFSVSSFHPLLLFFFLFLLFVFVQPVKCPPPSRVWEWTTSSTPPDDQTNGQKQQSPACGLFLRSSKEKEIYLS